jgi:hypothetical protein
MRIKFQIQMADETWDVRMSLWLLFCYGYGYG